MIISLWCLWQITAVALFSLPPHAPDPASRWLRQHLLPIVEPYLFATSQWQYWHMFVAERPPQEIEHLVQGFDQRGRLVVSQVLAAAVPRPLPSFCALPPHPVSLQLISRTYFGIDQALPPRSARFMPRWWETIQETHLCSTG